MNEFKIPPINPLDSKFPPKDKDKEEKGKKKEDKPKGDGSIKIEHGDTFESTIEKGNK